MSQFDQKAAQWDENPDRVKLAKAIADAIKITVPLNMNMTALEIGCGTGLVSMFLRNKVKEITALDNSGGMLEKLKEKIRKENIDNIRPVLADLSGQMEFVNNFDLVFSSMTFHHIDDFGGLLKKIFNMLKSGGIVAIADLEAEDGSFHPADTQIFHKGFEKQTFMKSLKNAGFVDVKFKTAFVINGASRGAKRDYPVFLATGKKI